MADQHSREPVLGGSGTGCERPTDRSSGPTAGVPDLEQLDAQLGDDAGAIKSLHPGGPRQWRTLVQQTAPMWLDYAGLPPDELRAIETPPWCSPGDRDEHPARPLDVALPRHCPTPSSPSAHRRITARPYDARARRRVRRPNPRLRAAPRHGLSHQGSRQRRSRWAR